MGYRIHGNWADVTIEDFIWLINVRNQSLEDIADMYSVDEDEALRKAMEFNVTQDNINNILLSTENSTIQKEFCKAKAKELIIKDVDSLAKKLAVDCFRNCPTLENRHSEGCLSENDMKEINIYASNRLAAYLDLVYKEEWFKLGVVLSLLHTPANWQQTIPDPDIELIWEHYVKSHTDRNSDTEVKTSLD